jgi:hypothetical protein
MKYRNIFTAAALLFSVSAMAQPQVLDDKKEKKREASNSKT